MSIHTWTTRPANQQHFMMVLSTFFNEAYGFALQRDIIFAWYLSLADKRWCQRLFERILLIALQSNFLVVIQLCCIPFIPTTSLLVLSNYVYCVCKRHIVFSCAVHSQNRFWWMIESTPLAKYHSPLYNQVKRIRVMMTSIPHLMPYNFIINVLHVCGSDSRRERVRERKK